MAITLTDIQERVERSIFECIRLISVDAGYTADIADLENTQEDYDTYQAAMVDIRTEKGFAVEIFSNSSVEAKAERKSPRIVINTRRALNGDLGTHLKEYKLNGETYDLVKHPFTSSDFQIDIHLVSSKAKQDRVLASILAASLSTRNYIDFYDSETNPKEKFFVLQVSDRYANDYTQGVRERIITYAVKDMYLAPSVVIAEGIAKIQEITIEKTINKDSGGETKDPDNLVVTN